MTSFNLLARQGAKPRGFLGRYFAARMEKTAALRNGWVLSHLDLQPTDYVLEVGYACGIDLARVAQTVTSGLVIGVDHSETMFHMAFKRNKQHIDTGRMQLQVGPASKLPFAFPYFDKAFSINVAGYSKEPVNDFVELKRVLRAGGLAVVAVAGLSEKAGNRLESGFRDAGFSDVRVTQKDGMICLVGRKLT